MSSRYFLTWRKNLDFCRFDEGFLAVFPPCQHYRCHDGGGLIVQLGFDYGGGLAVPAAAPGVELMARS